MQTMTMTEAAAAIGITERTLLRWCQEDPPRLKRQLVANPKPGWAIPVSEVERVKAEREAS